MEWRFAFDNSPKQRAVGIRQTGAEGDSCVLSEKGPGWGATSTGHRFRCDHPCSIAHTHGNVYMCRECVGHTLSYAQAHLKPIGCPIHAPHETLPRQVKDNGKLHSLAMELFPGRPEKMPKL